MATLPGKQNCCTPPLPGQGAPQPTAAQKSAIEAKWADMASIRPALAELIAVFDRHPELFDWLKASKEKSMTV